LTFQDPARTQARAVRVLCCDSLAGLHQQRIAA